MTENLPTDIKEKLDDWFNINTYEIIYFWNSKETYFVTVYYDETINFIRLFTINKKVLLSVDKVKNINDLNKEI
jgi:hypothetical protein